MLVRGGGTGYCSIEALALEITFAQCLLFLSRDVNLVRMLTSEFGSKESKSYIY